MRTDIRETFVGKYLLRGLSLCSRSISYLAVLPAFLRRELGCHIGLDARHSSRRTQMASTQILQQGIAESFADAEVRVEECTRCQEDAPESESFTGAEPQFQSSVSGCTSDVEAWINKQFGDDFEAPRMTHDESNSYTALVRQHVDVYMEAADFMNGSAIPTYDENDDADDLGSRTDSEEFEEPQLWCFSR